MSYFIIILTCVGRDHVQLIANVIIIIDNNIVIDRDILIKVVIIEIIYIIISTNAAASLIGYQKVVEADVVVVVAI